MSIGDLFLINLKICSMIMLNSRESAVLTVDNWLELSYFREIGLCLLPSSRRILIRLKILCQCFAQPWISHNFSLYVDSFLSLYLWSKHLFRIQWNVTYRTNRYFLEVVQQRPSVSKTPRWLKRSTELKPFDVLELMNRTNRVLSVPSDLGLTL